MKLFTSAEAADTIGCSEGCITTYSHRLSPPPFEAKNYRGTKKFLFTEEHVETMRGMYAAGEQRKREARVGLASKKGAAVATLRAELAEVKRMVAELHAALTTPAVRADKTSNGHDKSVVVLPG